MITFKEYYMLSEAPVAPLTPQEKEQARLNNQQMQSAPVGQVPVNARTPNPVSVSNQQQTQAVANNQQIQQTAPNTERPVGSNTRPVSNTTTQPTPAIGNQQPVTGPQAYNNRLSRVIGQQPAQAAANLIALKQEYDQAASQAYLAAQQERESGMQGDAVQSIRDWNKTGIELSKQAQSLQQQLAGTAEGDQLAQAFGENWKRIKSNQPLLIEHNGKSFEFIVA